MGARALAAPSFISISSRGRHGTNNKWVWVASGMLRTAATPRIEPRPQVQASHFRWAAKSAKSSFAQEELVGLAISLEAEADALEFHAASDERLTVTRGCRLRVCSAAPGRYLIIRENSDGRKIGERRRLLGGVQRDLYAEGFGSHRPARAMVPVPALHHGYLIELEPIAVREARPLAAARTRSELTNHLEFDYE